MKASLHTRCGCERIVVTTFPAPDVIALPMRSEPLTPKTAFDGKWEKCVGQVRYFKLIEGPSPGPLDTAFYGEVIP